MNLKKWYIHNVLLRINRTLNKIEKYNNVKGYLLRVSPKTTNRVIYSFIGILTGYFVLLFSFVLMNQLGIIFDFFHVMILIVLGIGYSILFAKLTEKLLA
jgi:hypothetical protein